MVLLFTIDAGGGHRAAARALRSAAAEEQKAPFSFRVENFQELLLPLDLLKRTTGLSLEGAYNLILRRRASVLMVPLLRLMHAAIRVRKRTLVRTLAAWFRAEPRPQAVISVFPNFNGVLRDALAEALPGVPLVVVLTDLADFPPRFWVEPGLGRVVVGTPEAAAQARSIGIPEPRISQVSGMILHPRFYRAGGPELRERVRRRARRRHLRLHGHAALRRQGLARDGAALGAAAALDPALRVVAGLRRQPGPAREPRPARGRKSRAARPLRLHRPRRPELMAASDLLVTKPGPGSLSEAFHQRVPVVVSRDIHTIPQERFNTEFVERRGLGLVVSGWRQIPAAVARLAREPERLAAMRAAIGALPTNRAVYEVIEIVAREASHPSQGRLPADAIISVPNGYRKAVVPPSRRALRLFEDEAPAVEADRGLRRGRAREPQGRPAPARGPGLRRAARQLRAREDPWRGRRAGGRIARTPRLAARRAGASPCLHLERARDGGLAAAARPAAARRRGGPDRRRQRPQRYAILFLLADGWQLEELDFALNTIRASLDARLVDQRVRGSFREAAEIQQSLLVEEPPAFAGFELAARSVPADEVGGDFYDFYDLGEGTLGLAIGDASGHGLPAALLVRDVVTGLRMGIEKELKVAHVFEKLNRVIHRSRLSSRFVSVFYAELERDGNLVYVNAGHQPPILFFREQRPGKPSEVELSNGGMVIGPLPEAHFRRGFARLHAGEVLLMLTDGILERRDKSGELFGSERVTKWCASTSRSRRRRSWRSCSTRRSPGAAPPVGGRRHDRGAEAGSGAELGAHGVSARSSATRASSRN